MKNKTKNNDRVRAKENSLMIEYYAAQGYQFVTVSELYEYKGK